MRLINTKQYLGEKQKQPARQPVRHFPRFSYPRTMHYTVFRHNNAKHHEFVYIAKFASTTTQ